MKSHRLVSASPLWGSLALIAALATAGLWFFSLETQQLRKATTEQLAAIARLKAEEIASWRRSLASDAAALVEGPLVAAAVARWIRSGGREGTAEIADHLMATAPHASFSAAFIADAGGQLLLGVPRTTPPLVQELSAAVEEARRTGKVVLTEPHRSAVDGAARIDAAAPLRDSQGRHIGSVIVSADAALSLYGLVASWPVPSETAETLLVRRDGEDVLFLNELRHEPGSALTLRIPLTSTDVPAVRAVLGDRGVVQGVDYRDRHVLAFIEAVPESNWLVVAKVDTAEAYAQVRSRSALLVALNGALLAAAVAIVALWAQRSQKVRYRAAYEAEIRSTEARAKAEAALRANERQFRRVVDEAADGMVVVQNDRIVLANPCALRLFGATAEQVAAAHYLDFTYPEDRPVIQARYALRAADKPVDGTVQYRIMNTDSEPIWVEAHTTAIDWEGAPAALVFLRDLTEHRKAEETLRESEERYRLLVQNASDAVYFHEVSPSAPGRFQEVNAQACRMLGYSREELLAMEVGAIDVPEQAERLPAILGELFRTGAARFETEHLAKDGRRIPVEVSTKLFSLRGRPMVLSLVRDITERRRTEAERAAVQERLQQSRRLEAVGLLAGGVAHDFNNMLAAILGYAELLREDLEPDSPFRTYVAEIIKAAGKSRNLIRQLLAFARKQALRIEPLDLNDIVTDIEPMLRRTLRDDVRLTLRLGAGVGPIEGDAGQIEQVILNLVVNAQEAMPQGGEVLIETAEIMLDEEYARRHVGVTPGPHVRVSVSDTGVGMDRDTLGRIFEPFFSTKLGSGGTGLGLATVYGIVNQHRGTIWPYSEPGKGSTFHVYLPRTEATPRAPAPPPPAGRLRGGEVILVAEDQEELRAVTREILERHGYRVLSAEDGNRAREIAASHEGRIDLLLTDVVMAGTNGRLLYEQLREKRPEIRVLYMSGYTADVIARHGVLEPGVAFLQKPFTVQDLTTAIGEVLAHGRQP